MNQFDRYRTPAEGENMPITEYGIPNVMARNRGIAMKGGGALSAAARRVQAAGTGEDKILVHINPAEYAELIRKHGPATYNDETGLPELGFFKKLGKILKIAAPVILSVALPGVGTAVGTALGATGTMASVLGSAIVGAGLGGVLGGKRGALFGGLGGGLGGWLQGASSLGGLTPAQYSNLSFADKVMVGNRLGFLGATDPAKSILQTSVSAPAVASSWAGDASSKFLNDPKFFPNAATSGFSVGSGLNFVDPNLAAKFSPVSAQVASAQAAETSKPLFDFFGKTKLTQSIFDPKMGGFMGAITSPLGIGASLLAASALSKSKTPESSPTWFNAPWSNKGAGTSSAIFNPTAPTLEMMQPTQKAQATPVTFMETPTGQVVPVSEEQAKVLANYAALQNAYGQQPVYARTGGLAQMRRYAEGGEAKPVRTALTADELKAQGMDWYKFGETPRPAGMQSFFKFAAPNVSVAPTTPAPVTQTPNQISNGNISILPPNWNPVTDNYAITVPDISKYLQQQVNTPEPPVVVTTAPVEKINYDMFDPSYFNLGYKKGGALSRYVRGEGDGQADKIPAMLSDGEYVMDAETVSALGNGSSEAGAKKLDEFRMSLRKHKRSAPVGKIPPKTKHLSKYMTGGSR